MNCCYLEQRGITWHGTSGCVCTRPRSSTASEIPFPNPSWSSGEGTEQGELHGGTCRRATDALPCAEQRWTTQRDREHGQQRRVLPDLATQEFVPGLEVKSPLPWPARASCFQELS